ncbi:MAG: cytochrome c [Candidatus Latescibacteria bacterium]|nr:cytochrome c [Candidatus Latescibacterota bacterium]
MMLNHKSVGRKQKAEGSFHPAHPLGWIVAIAFVLVGCDGTTNLERLRQEMYNQSKFQPLEKNAFFDDSRASRPWIAGTVARGHLRTDVHLYAGVVNGEPAKTFPFAITRDVLKRGQERYNIYCTPCHGEQGDGRGMVVRRGLKQPPSYHIERLQNETPGYFYDVMTNGFGAMYSYASRIKPHDRWAIVAYIQALQLSQNATLADVPADVRQRLENE